MAYQCATGNFRRQTKLRYELSQLCLTHPGGRKKRKEPTESAELRSGQSTARKAPERLPVDGADFSDLKVLAPICNIFPSVKHSRLHHHCSIVTVPLLFEMW